MNTEKKQILKIIVESPKTIDQIIEGSVMIPSKLMSLLSALEIDKYCFQSENLYILNKEKL